MLPSTLRTRWEGGRDGWRSWQGGGEDWRGGRRWQKGPVSLLAVWKDLLLHGWPQHPQEQVLQGGGKNGGGDGGESGLRPWVGDGQVGETPLKREKGCKAKLKSRVSLKEHIKFVHGERRISCPAPPCTQRWRKTSTILIYQVYCQPTLKHFSGSAEARTLPTTCAPCTAPPSCSATCARQFLPRPNGEICTFTKLSLTGQWQFLLRPNGGMCTFTKVSLTGQWQFSEGQHHGGRGTFTKLSLTGQWQF